MTNQAPAEGGPMEAQQFITKPGYYATNHRDAANLRTIPATITRPTGEGEPGVVVMVGRRIKLAMNYSQAYNLANDIADALEASRPRSNGACQDSPTA